MLPFERRSNKPPRPGGLARFLLSFACAAALACATAFAAAFVPPAWAGRYHVYSCRTPAGAPIEADGWSGSQIGTGVLLTDSCPHGGALLAALRRNPGREANTASATWEFAPPAGDQVVGATLWRAGDADGGATSEASDLVWLAGREPAFQFDLCDAGAGCSNDFGNQANPMAAENRISVGAANLGGALYAVATCRGLPPAPCAESGADANGFAAAIYLYAADLVLEQQSGPSVGGVGGELASAATVGGASPVTFTAGDPVSGIYEVVFSVDGRVVQTTVPSANGGRCANVNQTSDGLPAFLAVQPCPRSLNVQVAFDTTRVSNGTHHLAVSVLDAAGNAAPVLERDVNIHNAGGGLANGTNATIHAALSVRWAATHAKSLVAGFGHAVTVDGRLTTTTGAAIAGASVEVSAVPTSTGGRAAAMPAARTNSSGRFTVTVPGGVSSRTLRFAYRTHLGEETPAVTATLTLVVRAGIALHVSPAATGVGGRIHFSGHLRGGPVPRDGKQLVFEARSPHGPWIQFRDVRSDRHGRFHAGYRFKFPGPAHYQFRAVSEPESDYPYGRGASNLVSVFER
ncbi:MAG TPA: carboxypeptidase-like regulatory domain-containing protein [Solirubrobacteraceae bacterium]|nr:carboxypeptidase-like regulatory domain-containing protein [Solirubrobacteraceae bacterium]